MADSKLINLPAATVMADADLLYLVTDVGTVPASKKITVANARNALIGTPTLPGVWTDVPFNAANFTASGSMTWTVVLANQVRYSYMVVGRSLFLAFSINNTTIGGTPSTALLLKLPGTYSLAGNSVLSMGLYINNGAVKTGGYISVDTPNPTNMVLAKIDQTAYIAGTTHCWGQIVIPI